MIMKRKNIILSALLSLLTVCFSACASNQTGDADVTSLSENTSISSEQIETTEAITEVSTENTDITSETEESDTTTITENPDVTSEQTETTEETTTVTTQKTEVITEDDTPETEITTKKEEPSVTTVNDSVSENVEKKYIALTFDDGPSTTTGDVLDVLEKYNVKASFFLIGNNISSETEGYVKRAYDMGCEIGNHSKSHPDMSAMSEEEILEEVDYVNDYILKITGEEPKFFRPPYIAVSERMLDTIDLVFIAGFGANDWEEKVTADRRAASIIRQAKNGGIILLHDMTGNDKTVEALHTIIPELQAQGYEFVTVSELFEALEVTPVPHDKKIYTYADQQYMYG